MKARTATDPRTERVLREIRENPALSRLFNVTTTAGNELLEEDLDGAPGPEPEPPVVDPGDLSKVVNNPLLEEDIDAPPEELDLSDPAVRLAIGRLGTPGFPTAPPSLLEELARAGNPDDNAEESGL